MTDLAYHLFELDLLAMFVDSSDNAINPQC